MFILMLALVDTPEEQRLFRAMYDQHRGWMRKAAYRILQDPHRAEDAVNEAFFRVARKFSTLHINGVDTEETRGLLMIIVKNEARRIRDKEAGRAYHEVPLEEDQGAASGSEGDLYVEEEHILTDIRARAVLEEIQKMGEAYRDVLYLFLVEGQRIQDIAYELDLSVSAVKKRIQRGKELLRERLSVWGGETVE